MWKSIKPFPGHVARTLLICGVVAGALVAFGAGRALTGSDVLPSLQDEEILGIIVGMATVIAVWWALAWRRRG